MIGISLRLSTSEQTRAISLSRIESTETSNSLVITKDIGVRPAWIRSMQNQAMRSAIVKELEDR
jgi:hypothetical protein